MVILHKKKPKATYDVTLTSHKKTRVTAFHKRPEKGTHCTMYPSFSSRLYLKQECITTGCIPSAAVAMSIPACTGQGVGVCVSQYALGRGGICPGGHLPSGGVCPRGCLPRGVSAQGGGVCVFQHALRQTFLPCEQNN